MFIVIVFVVIAWHCSLVGARGNRHQVKGSLELLQDRIATHLSFFFFFPHFATSALLIKDSQNTSAGRGLVFDE